MSSDREIISRLVNIETMLSQLLGNLPSSSKPVAFGENADLIAMAMSGNREGAKAAALAKARREMAADKAARKALKSAPGKNVAKCG